MQALPRFYRRSADERWLLLRSAVLLTCARLGLRLFPYRSMEKCLGYLKRAGGPPPAESPFTPDRIAWAVQAAGRHLPGKVTCLPIALVTHTLLGREGYASRVEIGVAKDGAANLHAHAWVECEGKVFLAEEEEQSHFVRLRAQ